MRTWLAAALAAMLVMPAALRADELKSGPDKGATPMLMIKPVGSTGDAYCVTCKAGLNPSAVAFVTKNDEATQKLLGLLNERYKANKDRHFYATVVILGTGDDAQALAKWAQDQKLEVPIVTMGADNEGLKPWSLNDKAHTTVVLFKQHKVDSSLADPTTGVVDKGVTALMG